MSERPNLENKFGKRIGTCLRPNPVNGENAWLAEVIWEMEEYWVVCQMTGRIPYDWPFAKQSLGEEEEFGRFASFAKEFTPRSELDSAAIQARFNEEYSAEDRSVAWLQGWPAA